MSYKILEDISIADTAFEATGENLNELFESAAMAVSSIMVRDLSKVEPKTEKKISVKLNSGDVASLLHLFLEDLIIETDLNKMIFSKFKADVNKTDNTCSVKCLAYGEKIDPKRHDLGTAVKAVTLHKFEVKQGKNGWHAFVVLDI